MKIQVLDQGYIELVTSWGSDEMIIEAARMSTNKGFEGWGTAEKPGDEKLLAYLWKNRHYTPFEMAGAIFEVKAPIVVFREWHRHRTQSYNEMSARYVPLPNENYLPAVDDLVKRSEEAAKTKNRQASSTGVMLTPESATADLARLAKYYDDGQALYDEFLEHGWPKELARLVTTVGRYSRMRASGNLRNLLGFCELRSTEKNPHAQKEIRMYADAKVELLRNLFPRTIALFMGES